MGQKIKKTVRFRMQKNKEALASKRRFESLKAKSRVIEKALFPLYCFPIPPCSALLLLERRFGARLFCKAPRG